MILELSEEPQITLSFGRKSFNTLQAPNACLIGAEGVTWIFLLGEFLG